MLNNKNMIRTCRIFATFLLFVLIAILPAVAAGEEGNVSLQSLEGRIKSKVESETQKNPDLEHCKVVVTMVYLRDADSDEWVGHVEEVCVSTTDSSNDDSEHGETVAIDSDADDSFAGSDEDDSTSESEAGDSQAGNSIISWVLGIAFLALLLKFIFPWLKKRLPHESTPVDNIAGRQKTSTDGSPDFLNGMDSRSDADSTQDTKNAVETVTEKMEPTLQTEKTEPDGAVDEREKVHEVEKVETGMAKKHMEPAAPLKPIVKYGQIAVLSQDELVTENDYMSDNATGMPFEFTFSPGMEEGTYDIASNSKSSFLKDINMIRPYVQDFEALAYPKKIITISKGKLRKRGMQWVVIEKAKIELK